MQATLYLSDKPINSMCNLNWEDPNVEEDVSKGGSVQYWIDGLN